MCPKSCSLQLSLIIIQLSEEALETISFINSSKRLDNVLSTTVWQHMNGRSLLELNL